MNWSCRKLCKNGRCVLETAILPARGCEKSIQTGNLSYGPSVNRQSILCPAFSERAIFHISHQWMGNLSYRLFFVKGQFIMSCTGLQWMGNLSDGPPVNGQSINWAFSEWAVYHLGLQWMVRTRSAGVSLWLAWNQTTEMQFSIVPQFAGKFFLTTWKPLFWIHPCMIHIRLALYGT